MINDVYTTVQTILNKENSGYVSPSEFNKIAKQVQDQIFKGYFEDFNRDVNRANKGLTNSGYANLPKNQLQRITPFLTTATVAQSASVYTLPTDVYFIEENGVIDALTGRVVESAPISRQGYINSSSAAPTEVFPVYYRKGSVLTIFPSTFTGTLTVNYIKQPADPKWTYRVINNQELYDPTQGDFQDFELHPIEFPNIVIQMLTYFGINLREGEVIQVAESLKNQETVKDNN